MKCCTYKCYVKYRIILSYSTKRIRPKLKQIVFLLLTCLDLDSERQHLYRYHKNLILSYRRMLQNQASSSFFVKYKNVGSENQSFASQMCRKGVDRDVSTTAILLVFIKWWCGLAVYQLQFSGDKRPWLCIANFRRQLYWWSSSSDGVHWLCTNRDPPEKTS